MDSGFAGEPPNVVVYLVDTLRADHLGVYGYQRPTSPRLDDLARRSVVFEEAIAPAPWTLPSVVSLMTSTFSCEHGVTSQGKLVSPALRTLAQLLQERGYNTASLFANQYAGTFSGLDRGFDATNLMGLKARKHPEELVEMLLEDRPPGPLFLYIHTVEPHDPYHPPENLLARFERVGPETRGRINALSRRYRTLTNVDWREGRPVGSTDNTAAQIRTLAALAAFRDEVLDLYDASILQADRRMGRVLDTLQRFGEWENTLFVFLSDPGEEFGEHGGWQHDHSLFRELTQSPS
ncbi:MAG: sulfatase [Thermoanaerobaculia bacterium]|nr:sulfatase [Thermoanaerobaculia bacterium]